MSQKDLLALLLLVLAVVAGVQLARYHVQLDSVEKTVASLVPEYHQRGLRAYRHALFDELGRMGLDLAAEDVEIVEDRLHDELEVVVRYSWPMDVLAWRLERDHVVRMTAPLFEI